MSELAPSCWNQNLFVSDGYRVCCLLLRVLRTSTYCSFVNVAVVRDSSMKSDPTIPLAKIAVHTVHLGGCSGLVATLLGLAVPQKTFVFEFTFPSR